MTEVMIQVKVAMASNIQNQICSNQNIFVLQFFWHDIQCLQNDTHTHTHTHTNKCAEHFCKKTVNETKLRKTQAGQSATDGMQLLEFWPSWYPHPYHAPSSETKKDKMYFSIWWQKYKNIVIICQVTWAFWKTRCGFHVNSVIRYSTELVCN